ncbi:MAG: hypothetical protein IGS48_14585 [Oscillatoriales cyanobacterium C42_A2020_001]|nr:hypothetical protein [Leptolyngbyaceae cyanobacterium C42_A2020_001]
MATSPTSYLQTLSKEEAIAFVTSLQKVKEYLSQELQWINEQAHQKTTQLQGIETLLAEAVELGLLAPNAVSTIETTSTVEAAPMITAPVNSADDLAIASTLNGDALSNHLVELMPTTDAESSRSPQKQGNGRKQKTALKTKTSTKQPASKSSGTRTKKTSTSAKSAAKANQSSLVDLRQLLKPEFQGKTFTDTVSEILDSAPEPLHLNDLLAEMYEDLSDQNFRRAKVSLANVLSVGTKKGNWKSLGKGLYTGNK